ncbi:MAG: hypothetical protein AAFP15_09080 [Bacteroidota bacterium]
MTVPFRTLRLAALAALALLLAAPAWAQGQIDRNHVPSDARVDLFERRNTDIDGNRLRTTIFNFGQTGRTSAQAPDEIPYEWPKNTRRTYIALTGLFTGAELPDDDDDDSNPEYIVNVPNYRENLDDPNQAWTWAPVDGYTNPASEDLGIPRSDRPETWPSFWPNRLEDPTDPGWAGSWNGFFGRDVFNADQEIYYVMGDDQYPGRGVRYFPDSTDLTRRGLGLVVETRVLAWSQVLIQDAIFILHSVKNDGTEDLSTVGVTLWLADFVGGSQDADDDRPFFDLLLDTAFMADADGRSTTEGFANAEVAAGIAFFLESPGNAVDRIDNDGDGTTGDDVAQINGYGVSIGEPGSPIITADFLAGEGDQTGGSGERLRFDGIDNNGNGVVDEDSSYAAFGTQVGVGYADYIDNDGDGEVDSPVVTQEMIDEAAGDRWNRWPALAEPYDGSPVHLVGVGPEDLGLPYRDGIDNDGDGLESTPPFDFLFETDSPVVTQAMIDAAASDAPYFRFEVPGTDIILYDVKAEDLGLPYADGIDNDGDGAVDEGIDENIDEMIDERRDDGIDNDGDWRSTLDDVGLDGSDLTGDVGENDGLPSSGAGTDLPGEPNIDVTDISESDQIGITNVRYRPAGSVSFQSDPDSRYFTSFLTPGKFTLLQPGQPPPGGSNDNDLFVSSGLFPLRAGQTERVSFAVIFGDVNYQAAATNVEQRYQDHLAKRQNAQEAYEADYRFAQAPTTPTVRAVARDGAVTLYWDDEAERSFDTFIADLDAPGLNPNDFEGYRVYRATDPGFLDARTITDGFGNLQFLRPIAQYDLINGNEGFHPVDIAGTKYFLGSDTRDPGEASDGLVHTFTDTEVINGVTYYYAVVSYDFGAFTLATQPGQQAFEIPPTESPISISIRSDGSLGRTGPNVVAVTPEQGAGGYIEADLTQLEQTRGLGTGVVNYTILDPTAIQDGNRYRITFRDTLLLGSDATQDTLTTLDFTLEDLTDGEVLIENSEALGDDDEVLVTEGFQLSFENVGLTTPIDSLTGWSDDAVYDLEARRFNVGISGNQIGLRFPADYRVVVGQPGSGQSVALPVRIPFARTLPAKPTNFRVFQQVIGSNGQIEEVEVPYAFWDLTGDGAVQFEEGTAATNLFSLDLEALGGQGDSDIIVLLQDVPGDGTDDLVPTWQFKLSIVQGTGTRNPQAGDEGALVTAKPFLASDAFEFVAQGPDLDVEAAQATLDDIKVVPNPYIVTNRFEPQNPFPTGRGDRVIRFTRLPPRATIRIFTVSGRLVEIIEHNEGSNEDLTPEQLLDGVAEWDLLTQDRLSASYGVYLYHVDAPGIGETTGTFALIK